MSNAIDFIRQFHASEVKKIVIHYQDGHYLSIDAAPQSSVDHGFDIQVDKLLREYTDLFKRQNTQDYLKCIDGWNRLYVLPAIGEKLCGDITTSQVQELLNSIPHNNTRKKVKTYLKGFFTWLHNEGIIARNPVGSVKLKPTQPIKRRAFEFAEQNQMLELLPMKYRGVFFFLCCTSMRLGEFCAFDRSKAYDGKLHVYEAWNNKTGKVGKCKTVHSNREIPYSEELFETARALSGDIDIFGSDITYCGIKEAFAKAIARLKDCPRGQKGKLSTHSTRHTFSSICYYLGVRDKQIQEWMGHATASMTIDTYTHLVQDGSSKILEYLTGLVSFYKK